MPILALSDGTIVDGHLRLKAAQKLKIETVPVILCDELTSAQVKAFRLMANKSVAWAEWDTELLRFEMEELKSLDFDLELTGFGEEELARILEPAQIEGLTDPDSVPDLPSNPVTVPGDLWILGKHRLMCGDSTFVDKVQRLFNGVEPILMVTDPPYGVGYDPKWRNSAGLSKTKGTRIRMTLRRLILDWLFETRSDLANPDPWFMAAFGGPMTATGIRVTPDSAMRFTAVYAAVRILAETVATLPLIVYRRTENNGGERATDYFLYGLLHDQPNEEQTSVEFREMLQIHLALRGNAYAQIDRKMGQPSRLVPLHPDRVEVERNRGGELIYRIHPDSGSPYILSQRRGEVMHIKNVKVTRALNSVVAGTSSQNGSVIDMSGFEGVQFIALFGALTATQVTSLKVQRGSQSDGSDMADLEGSLHTALADSDGNKCLVTDVFRPQKRYVRAVVTRGTTNAVIDGVIALQYSARVQPITNDTTVKATKLLISPDEGTA